MCCVLLFIQCVFGSTPRRLSTLESRLTLPCCNLLTQSPFTLARSLRLPTLLNGLAQPHHLMADWPCGEFNFYIYFWDFWQLTSIYWKSSLFGAVPFTVVPTFGSYKSEYKGLVNSLHWTMSLKSLRLRIAREGVGSRGERFKHSRQRVPGAKGVSSGRGRWDVKGTRLSALIQVDGGCYCSADTVLGALPERSSFL